MRKTGLIVALFLVMITTVGYSQTGRFQLTAAQKAVLTQRLDGQWANMFEPELKKGTSLRDVVAFALNAASVAYRPERIETALDYVNQNINRSTKNPATYGNIFWYHGDTVINDRNGVEFCMRHAALIWILYREQLSPKARQKLREIVEFSIEGIKRHQVALSYTNIILMKAANLILLGESCDRPALAQEGYQILREWVVYTYRNGLCEFLSPTYYAVDIENLSLIYHLSKHAESREIAAKALEYLWTDIAVNWYEPSQRLGGTHSRDYDRLYGHNAVDQLVERAGWSDIEATGEPAPAVFNYYAFVPPAAPVRQYLTAPLPRFVSERWGEQEYQRVSNYYQGNFSVASAEANYHNMDKTPLVINLGGGYETPVINYFLDGREDYYGFKTILEKSGHRKSLHLKPFITSVQNDGEVLFLASCKDDSDPTADKLESVVTLPAAAELWLDNQQLDVFNSRSAWQTVPAANSTTTRFKVVTMNGKPVVQISDRDPNAGIGLQQKLRVSPGKTYKLKARMKGQTVSLYLNFYDRNNQLIQGEHQRGFRLKKDDYTWNEIVEKAPEQASYCQAWIYSPIKNTTEVLLDDLSVEESDAGNATKIVARFDFKEAISQRLVIGEGENLFVKRGDVVAALRLVKALDVSGRPVPLILANDGLHYGALRLTATHSQAKTGGRGTIIIWSYTGDGISDDQKFSAFRRKVMAVPDSVKIKQSIFNVKVSGITGALELTADVLNEQRIFRKGMKTGLTNSLLSVNGRDVGREILEGLTGINYTGAN